MKRLFPCRLVVVPLLALQGGFANAAEPQAEVLTTQLAIEERLLERARDQYREARSLERDVLRSLRDSSNAQDTLLDGVLREALGSSSPVVLELGQPQPEPVSVRRLKSAERELAGTRETALTLARESADWRRDLIARAERIRELRLEIARQGGGAIVDSTGLDGLWQVELEGADISGVIDFDSEGTLVTGTYRLDDGSQGSVRGTLAGGRLELERVDWSRGFDTTLRGDFDAAAGTIRGTWTAVDVSGGAPGSGAWTARRVKR